MRSRLSIQGRKHDLQRKSCVCYSDRRNILFGTAGLAASGVLHSPSSGAYTGVQTSQLQVPKRALTDDLMISEIVKGNWQLSGGHRGDRGDDRTTGTAAVADFDAFVRAGITTFDTADIYGPSESLIGDYIRQRPQGRNGLQLLTKCCKFGGDMLAVSPKSISGGITRSLDAMAVKRLDLVQFYWHDYSIPKYVYTAQLLSEEVARGRVAALGVTNFDVPRMQQMMDGGARLVSNQIQYSLLDRRPENAMVEFCKSHDIKLLAFGTVAGGFLSEKYLGVPAEKLKVNTYSKSKYASVIAQNGGWAWFQRLLGELDGVARKHGTSIANVSCRWVLDKPQVAGLLVGARNANHVPDHVALAGLRLDDEDRARIGAVLAEGRQAQGDCYDWERGGLW